MASASHAPSAVSEQRTFLGHPIGLYILFFTEMWERFSYYGMRALLQLYMINHFLWSQSKASMHSKWYTSLVYLTPILGGFLADRYLGNKWAVIIGGVAMAIGHFCMAFEQVEIFYAALALLIIGNGFFKPNMTTQVGRLYAVGDPRRDGAYTIFYMGINLGAFLSPLICGALAATPGLGFHWGFGAAGVGMVIGLLTYLLGLPLIKELPPNTVYEGPGAETSSKGDDHGALTEEQCERVPSTAPFLSGFGPIILLCSAVGALVLFPYLWKGLGLIGWDSAVGLGVGGAISAAAGAWIVSKQKMAVRDRVMAIVVLGLFSIFFWAAFEQASNAMNVFADKTTNRFVTDAAPTPSIYPATAAEGSDGDQSVFKRIFEAFAVLFRVNPVSTANFQSINPFAIFLLAPLFAWLWTTLPRHGVNLSIPAKMAIGVFLQSFAFALMVYSVQFEDQPSSTSLQALPAGVWVHEVEGHRRVVFRDAPDLTADETDFAGFAKGAGGGHGEVIGGGRIEFGDGKLAMRGVLADTDRDRMLRASVSPQYLHEIRQFAQESAKAKEMATAAKQDKFSVKATLSNVPEGFDMRFAGFNESEVQFDAATRTLTSTIELRDRDYKRLLHAGTDKSLRDAMNDLFVKSSAFKVSVWWLFWFYILCTIGELCISPVGLSMVSKLAPAKFSTMLMGMWLLTSFFGNYVAGLAGESYGTVHPFNYFGVITLALLAASVLCFFLVRKVVSMMHGVR